LLEDHILFEDAGPPRPDAGMSPVLTGDRPWIAPSRPTLPAWAPCRSATSDAPGNGIIRAWPCPTDFPATCLSAPAREKAYKLTDAHQLYLFAAPKGGKLWRMDYAFDGKRKCLSIGPYPPVSLVEASKLSRPSSKTFSSLQVRWLARWMSQSRRALNARP